MTQHVCGHDVSRIVQPDGYDSSLVYKCANCSLQDTAIVAFDAHDCTTSQNDNRTE